ncbi:MAG: phosphatase PAP2 family protein [Paludibacteraceae bacterium]|nr:phosphatase PAP2 family protein [Paludibacteraceae bacterium]
MFEQLIHIDRQWLLAINGAHSPLADALFWTVSQTTTWVPLYALLVALLIMLFRRQRTKIGSWHVPTVMVALLLFALAVGGADLICAQLIKPLVARPRPTHDAELSALVHIVNGYRGGAYGFCSNHAANTLACVILFAAIYTHNKPWQAHLYITLPLMLWVLLNCYSRMYLGVHYPLDILAGLVVGTVMAWVAWRLGRGCLFPNDAHARRCDEG